MNSDETLEVPYRSRKDSRNWCKGIQGREHEVEWVEQFSGWAILTCKKCGRRLDYTGSKDSVNLARELRRIRKEKGVTQENLAQMSGMNQETISTIETSGGYYRHGQEPKLSTFEKLFRSLGYRIVIGITEIEQG